MSLVSSTAPSSRLLFDLPTPRSLSAHGLNTRIHWSTRVFSSVSIPMPRLFADKNSVSEVVFLVQRLLTISQSSKNASRRRKRRSQKHQAPPARSSSTPCSLHEVGYRVCPPCSCFTTMYCMRCHYECMSCYNSTNLDILPGLKINIRYSSRCLYTSTHTSQDKMAAQRRWCTRSVRRS